MPPGTSSTAAASNSHSHRQPLPLHHAAAVQSAARERPRPPNVVLEEAERQWLFSQDELLRTPSCVDGMSPDEERELRGKGVNFIMQVGIMLRLPQLTLWTASVFFNRFLMRHSLKQKPGYKPLHHYQVAATSLYLATKVEENCRKMKELVIACCRVAQKNPNLVVDEQTKDYWRWRDTILFNEDVLLETICFDVTVEHPHRILFDLLKYYGVEHNKPLRSAAWAFINDSTVTQLCVLFSSRTIAAAALYCGARQCDVRFPDDDRGWPWWAAQHVHLRDIRRACNYMAGVYDKPHAQPHIYVGLRTPEDGDARYAKTRLMRSQTPASPSAAAMERGASDQGVKRKPEHEDGGKGRSNGRSANGDEGPDLKKLKVGGSAGEGNADVSEEGELEE
ncbi:cyclin-like protein [Lineolata rhizophorae]|uniref:RNA polymerase II holoenzyme cyclin-like subunit n=1 Tax=Lineolata rhizophorae TaxID=578093 RepID=A0A6A6P124_9PEZI|nr:cyclin-like protein [Lineolata rhizophorae]